MYDEPKPEEAPPPPPLCAICTEPSLNAFWGDVHICDECILVWKRSAPDFEAIDVAHAAKHPEDIIASGRNQWVNQDAWVLLKRDVSARLHAAAADAWLQRARSRARAA